MELPLVSAVVTTFNRARDARVAVAHAVAQAYPASALEIIVVDDGSTDDTDAMLVPEYGDRIRYFKKDHGGVSAARNFGLAQARGKYLALLDDDDEWRPEKTARQVALLEARPEIGMVVTDVELMDAGRVAVSVFRRRDWIPEDGWVLPYVLRRPDLVPSSAMFRRDVLEEAGGFDTGLRTAEDLDFHLRVALAFQEAVIAEPLTRAMVGHEGLSALPCTNHDYLTVVERFLREHPDVVSDRRTVLFSAYIRNARYFLGDGDFGNAARLAAKSALRARAGAEMFEVGKLGLAMAWHAGARARRRFSR